MTTFSVDFLGCKVSYRDAQDVGARLLAGGMTEVAGGAEVAVLNTCCVTHEAVRKSRKAARRAARASKNVYVTGCAANLPGVFDDLPAPFRAKLRRAIFAFEIELSSLEGKYKLSQNRSEEDQRAMIGKLADASDAGGHPLAELAAARLG